MSFLLLFIVSSQLLTGCEDQKDTGTNDSQTPDKLEKAVYQHEGLTKYNPPIELHLVKETGQGLRDLIDNLPGETLEDNRWSKLYKQDLGIEIIYDWKAEGDIYYRKLGSVLASGNLPDVVKVNAQQLRQLNNAGLIQDLSEVYDKYATPFSKEIINQEGPAPLESATIDEKLMGIPNIQSSLDSVEFLWIRMDWLDNLDLGKPQNIEDVLTISKAFTAEDPDQNGQHDTLGLSITQHLWDPVMGLTGFMAGFEAYPKIWIENNDGQLVYGGIQPDVKDALEVLQEMYREGQLDSEFYLKDGDRVKELIADGKIGMLYGEQWSSFVIGSSRNGDPTVQWQAFPIVSNGGELAKVPLKVDMNQFFVVREGFEHPEAVIKMINLHLEKNWGKTAEYNKYYSNPFPVWQLSPITPYPALKNLEAYRQLERARLSGDYSRLEAEANSIHNYITSYLTQGDDSGWGWERSYGPDGAFAILDSYVENNQLLRDSFIGPPTTTMIEKKTILDNYMHDTFVNIILGNPIDDFDDFVNKWYNMGGAKLTEEVNQWYTENN
ncbi:extracellular solute-binding protein [Gracilibacillus oryzae]|uniref:Extracellular solute-binding protein n=1 Tax=Gracilibacillus oryzae TaxID=1672701 RepID=A0A7C8L2T1_9BACI|nr:extracellular solute-binding protein [Gracilibacillus oryzae]